MSLQYSVLPERAERKITSFLVAPADTPKAPNQLLSAGVDRRAPDDDGDQEVLHGVAMTHRFIQSPGDSEELTWHFVEAGVGEPIVLLHGIPDSWYAWHHQVAALSHGARVIAVDLKGYGQSDKRRGDYRHEGVAEQLLAMLDAIGVEQFNLVTHDRGTPQGDWLAARHPDRVLRYVRGEQHLYHYHPSLSPQEELFANSPQTGVLRDPAALNERLGRGSRWRDRYGISDEEMLRINQEFAYEGIPDAVPRYFNSSSFRKEWIDRRNHLMASWRCPVMIIQGYHSLTQPREFYEDAAQHIPNAAEVQVRYIDAGHFWSVENPSETTAAIQDALAMRPRHSRREP